MLKKYVHWRRSHLVAATFLAVLCCFFSANGFAVDFFKAGSFQLKKDFGPAVHMDQTLMTVHIPLNISNMPGAWKNATVKVQGIVVFFDSSGEPIGMGGALNDQFVSVSLNNGSYSGTVDYPIKSVEGAVSGSACAMGIALAELGDQTMFLGTAVGASSTGSSLCADFGAYPIAPGTIIQ